MGNEWWTSNELTWSDIATSCTPYRVWRCLILPTYVHAIITTIFTGYWVRATSHTELYIPLRIWIVPYVEYHAPPLRSLVHIRIVSARWQSLCYSTEYAIRTFFTLLTLLILLLHYYTTPEVHTIWADSTDRVDALWWMRYNNHLFAVFGSGLGVNSDNLVMFALGV